MKLSYKLDNAERASIDPPVGAVDLIEGNLTVSPADTTTYTLTMFGRDGVTERQRVTVNVRPRERTAATRETAKKRDKPPAPGTPIRDASAGKRSDTAKPAPGGSLQIGIGPAGVRIPIAAGPRAPSPSPKPTRRPPQIGIGRGVSPPD